MAKVYVAPKAECVKFVSCDILTISGCTLEVRSAVVGYTSYYNT